VRLSRLPHPLPQRRTVGRALASVWFLAMSWAMASDSAPLDARIRVLAYAADEVYRLRGYVGYQIDLEFEAGESFVGLGTGDLDGLTFAAQDNHLFLKPRAGGIDTNLTVLTTRRAYHFDYSASARRPDPSLGEVVYVLRFSYPPPTPALIPDKLAESLVQASSARWHNLDYRYRGNAELKPVAAWDDGVQTRLRFAPQQELPAIFVRNDDASESLLNFSVEADEIVVHRVARRLVLRRGQLQGCILNNGFTGSGERLESGTVSPGVQRVTRGGRP
jgi:type IV secretion system protein VirB9